jgi:hypothetical protein
VHVRRGSAAVARKLKDHAQEGQGEAQTIRVTVTAEETDALVTEAPSLLEVALCQRYEGQAA